MFCQSILFDRIVSIEFVRSIFFDRMNRSMMIILLAFVMQAHAKDLSMNDKEPSVAKSMGIRPQRWRRPPPQPRRWPRKWLRRQRLRLGGGGAHTPRRRPLRSEPAMANDFPKTANTAALRRLITSTKRRGNFMRCEEVAPHQGGGGAWHVCVSEVSEGGNW